ncbi:MAG: hypothetical protein ACRDS0_04900 [Pseudonocardiaceae bacterium]
MLRDRQRKTLPQAQRVVQIEDPDHPHSLEAVEPHVLPDHHWWALPVGVVLAVVLTVPGPSTLVEAEVAARNRPPRPRIRRNAATSSWGDPRRTRRASRSDGRSAQRTRPPGSRLDGPNPRSKEEAR